MTGKYRHVWRTFGAAETIAIVRGVLLGVGATVIATVYAYRFEGLSRVVFALDGAILTFLLLGSRVAITQLDEYLMRQRTTGRRVLIYGAGRAGSLLVREILQNPALQLIPVGFIDDDASKRRTRLDGVPVVGAFDDLAALVESCKPAEILISIQGLPPARLAVIEEACRVHGLALRRMRFALDDVGPTRIARHAG
jgi:UDP-GlcNAc:undecaprenyl-phosphate GlcNAc-1-phosphate transferase